MQGPNRDARLLDEGTEAEPTHGQDLHPGDQTPIGGAWVEYDGTTTHVDGGLIYWGAGNWRDTTLPERWHVNAAGAVDVGDQ